MEPIDNKDIKKWAAAWKGAADSMERIKADELRSYDYSKNQIVVDAMLNWGCRHFRKKLSSGLVQQQRLFLKLKNHKI